MQSAHLPWWESHPRSRSRLYPRPATQRKAAGVPEITPCTASRHAAGSYLARARVTTAVIAAWLGHADAGFTMKTYVHARPEDLAAARDALAARKTAEE